MDRYGYYGRVSYLEPVNRYKPNYRGAQGLRGVGGFGPSSVKPVRSGSYVGAPGKRVRGMHRNSAMQSDYNMMRGLGITLTGPGGMNGQTEMSMRMGGLGVSDREACRILTSIGSEIITAVVRGARPSQEPGESDSAYRARISDYEQAQSILGTADEGTLAALQNLCNLIDEAEDQSTVSDGGGGPSAAEIARARAQFEQLSSNGGGMSTGTKVAIGGGVALAAGAAIYFLVF